MTAPHARSTRVVLLSADADPSDDDLLIQALRQGTVDGVAVAFDRWHQRIRVLARRLLWDDAAAEDVVQEVFVSLPRAIRSFRGEARLETFLLAIAVRRARHHQRAATRRLRALDRLAAQPEQRSRDPEHFAYRRQLGNHLAVALSRLPLPQRVAFVLCEVEGLSSVEAAPIANVPEKTVRTRLFHARRRLRALLSKERAE